MVIYPFCLYDTGHGGILLPERKLAGSDDRSALSIARLYLGAGARTMSFVWLRWTLTPYDGMAARLPSRGKLLDLASGHGLLSLALALGSGWRDNTGVDHDERRVHLASAAAQRLRLHSRLRFRVGTFEDAMSSLQKESFDGIAMIDMLHYFDADTQRRLVQQAGDLLSPLRTLLMREIDPGGGPVSAWNRLYERIATRTGFTRSRDSSLHFRSSHDWKALLESLGFAVRAERCSSFLFSDMLYVATKGAEEVPGHFRRIGEISARSAGIQRSWTSCRLRERTRSALIRTTQRVC